jgi:Protein of unknown function (DUF3176)
MIPVGSAVSQASWIWFSAANQDKGYKTQLVDLETFDDASREAWGSLGELETVVADEGQMCCFNLQVKIKEENANQVTWHYRHLLSIGALLTILSLGFDILLQFILKE